MIDVTVQFATGNSELPEQETFVRWVRESLTGIRDHAELAIRIVDEAESARLNETYRDKSGPTNVLSFPAELPAAVDLPQLGDIIICASVVDKEAREQGKPSEAHWAHMVVHGLLHLLGYDHQQEKQAAEMEKFEAEILGRLGYPDPYT